MPEVPYTYKGTTDMELEIEDQVCAIKPVLVVAVKAVLQLKSWLTMSASNESLAFIQLRWGSPLKTCRWRFCSC
jgi:hypothetical protein